MKLIGLAVLGLALTFCGIGDRLKGLSGETNSSSPANTSASESGGSDAETAELTASQKAILEGGEEIKWDAQNISWKVPSGWPKMQMMKESVGYGSPAKGFMSGSISVMPSTFPSESSITATYDSALEQLKQGKYEKVRWLEIDGVKGVEWVESAPEEKDGIRRHQWIAFRNYQGQNQQLNFILSTTGDKFAQQRDEFAAILYSMKIAKG